ncbi:MAG: helix-turn-helix transcriptional regulator [Acidobacteria bacterium]|nr:helix-turn-helix transcriptional regulator [Acidobacteriota bacterium]TDI53108.1 MAG: XRE family transcriptional regulator [Acidobacteriota bacterium]TDI54744.1 MAG: XRE family transcriptional regulator [Acidobacteriota bacterium]
MGGPYLVDKFNASLGQKLRAARRQRAWSLGQVESRTLGEFKASVVGAYERGERAISVQRFVRLAGIYGVAASDLLPLVPSDDDLVIDLDALGAASSDDLVERYLAAIQLLRRDSSHFEIRRGDQAILGSLVQTVDPTATSDETR